MVLDIFTKTLNNVWPMIAIFLSVVIIVRVFYLITNNKKITLYKEIFGLLFIIYILLLFELLTATDTNNYHGINLTPFAEISRYQFASHQFNINVFGNIFIFIPFGIFIASYLNAKKAYPCFIIATLTSITVELVQLKIGRSFDIDDIILNVLGALLGYLIYKFLKALKKKLPDFLKKDIIYNIISLLVFGCIIYWLANRIGLL